MQIFVEYLFSTFIIIPYPREIKSTISRAKVFLNAVNKTLKKVNGRARFPLEL